MDKPTLFGQQSVAEILRGLVETVAASAAGHFAERQSSPLWMATDLGYHFLETRRPINGV